MLSPAVRGGAKPTVAAAGTVALAVPKVASRHMATHARSDKAASPAAASPHGIQAGAGGGDGAARDYAGALARALPTERTAEQKERRMAMFDHFDPNGNGYLSLAEVDKGLHATFGLEGVYNCKPAIIRAFNAAK